MYRPTHIEQLVFVGGNIWVKTLLALIFKQEVLSKYCVMQLLKEYWFFGFSLLLQLYSTLLFKFPVKSTHDILESIYPTK